MKSFPFPLILLVLVAGCVSHGTWSKSDRGAWADLDGLIGNHERSYYEKQWGEPVSRQDTKSNDGDGRGKVKTDGEELLWLWRPDGTGPSDQPGQGWEMFLSFHSQGSLRNWRIGEYHSTLTVPDVIAVTRKFEYRFGDQLLGELGLLKEQHGIASSRFDYPSANLVTRELDSVNEQYSMGPKWRGWAINRFQETVRVIVEATYRADNAARNLHSRLATDDEVLLWLEKQAKASNRSRSRQHTPQGVPSPGVPDQGQSGLLGRGFLAHTRRVLTDLE